MVRAVNLGVFVVAGLAWGWAAAAYAGPIKTPVQAVARLRQPDLQAAVKEVDAACRGRLRRSLKDYPPLLRETKRLLKSASSEKRMRALDLHRCFSEAPFVELLVARFDDQDPEVVAYAAEVSARLESSSVVAPLLDRLERSREPCLQPGLAPPRVEVCVWLTYAPGPSLVDADRALRERAGRLAATMALNAPYPKVREVAVETLAATRLKRHAQTVGQLIAQEREGAFSSKNDEALLGRFKKRKRALARTGE